VRYSGGEGVRGWGVKGEVGLMTRGRAGGGERRGFFFRGFCKVLEGWF